MVLQHCLWKAKRVPENKVLNKTSISNTTSPWFSWEKRPSFLRKEWHVGCLSEITVIMLMKGFVKRSKQEHRRSDKSAIVWPVGLVDYQEHPCRPAATSDGWILQIPMLPAQMEEEDPFCSCTALQGAGGRALTAMSRSGWRSGWRSCYKNFSTICQQRDSWAFSSQESCITAWRGGA